MHISDVYTCGTIRSQQIGKLSEKSSRVHWKASVLPISVKGTARLNNVALWRVECVSLEIPESILGQQLFPKVASWEPSESSATALGSSGILWQEKECRKEHVAQAHRGVKGKRT